MCAYITKHKYSYHIWIYLYLDKFFKVLRKNVLLYMHDYRRGKGGRQVQRSSKLLLLIPNLCEGLFPAPDQEPLQGRSSLLFYAEEGVECPLLLSKHQASAVAACCAQDPTALPFTPTTTSVFCTSVFPNIV